MKSVKLTKYRCENPACSLGVVGEPGHFTSGATPESLNVLTGNPVESFEDDKAGETHGEGVCPNCGKKGTATDEDHVVMEGSDPFEHLHEQVAARVADPDDKTTVANAQSVFEQMAKGVGDE